MKKLFFRVISDNRTFMLFIMLSMITAVGASAALGWLINQLLRVMAGKG